MEIVVCLRVYVYTYVHKCSRERFLLEMSISSSHRVIGLSSQEEPPTCSTKDVGLHLYLLCGLLQLSSILFGDTMIPIIE